MFASLSMAPQQPNGFSSSEAHSQVGMQQIAGSLLLTEEDVMATMLICRVRMKLNYFLWEF